MNNKQKIIWTIFLIFLFIMLFSINSDKTGPDCVIKNQLNKDCLAEWKNDQALGATVIGFISFGISYFISYLFRTKLSKRRKKHPSVSSFKNPFFYIFIFIVLFTIFILFQVFWQEADISTDKSLKLKSFIFDDRKISLKLPGETKKIDSYYLEDETIQTIDNKNIKLFFERFSFVCEESDQPPCYALNIIKGKEYFQFFSNRDNLLKVKDIQLNNIQGQDLILLESEFLTYANNPVINFKIKAYEPETSITVYFDYMSIIVDGTAYTLIAANDTTNKISDKFFNSLIIK